MLWRGQDLSRTYLAHHELEKRYEYYDHSYFTCWHGKAPLVHVTWLCILDFTDAVGCMREKQEYSCTAPMMFGRHCNVGDSAIPSLMQAAYFPVARIDMS